VRFVKTLTLNQLFLSFYSNTGFTLNNPEVCGDRFICVEAGDKY
jgi:hypothetical protein